MPKDYPVRSSPNGTALAIVLSDRLDQQRVVPLVWKQLDGLKQPVRPEPVEAVAVLAQVAPQRVGAVVTGVEARERMQGFRWPLALPVEPEALHWLELPIQPADAPLLNQSAAGPGHR